MDWPPPRMPANSGAWYNYNYPPYSCPPPAPGLLPPPASGINVPPPNWGQYPPYGNYTFVSLCNYIQPNIDIT